MALIPPLLVCFSVFLCLSLPLSLSLSVSLAQVPCELAKKWKSYVDEKSSSEQWIESMTKVTLITLITMIALMNIAHVIFVLMITLITLICIGMSQV